MQSRDYAQPGAQQGPGHEANRQSNGREEKRAAGCQGGRRCLQRHQARGLATAALRLGAMVLVAVERRITVREMLAFTLYDNVQHVDVVERRYREGVGFAPECSRERQA